MPHATPCCTTRCWASLPPSILVACAPALKTLLSYRSHNKSSWHDSAATAARGHGSHGTKQVGKRLDIICIKSSIPCNPNDRRMYATRHIKSDMAACPLGSHPTLLPPPAAALQRAVFQTASRLGQHSINLGQYGLSARPLGMIVGHAAVHQGLRKPRKEGRWAGVSAAAHTRHASGGNQPTMMVHHAMPLTPLQTLRFAGA